MKNEGWKAITDEDGDVANRYHYTDSWGNFVLSCPSVNIGKPCIPNRYAFTGREWDPDLDLYYYRARWYDPDTKRFTQEDPVFESNKYTYVRNNPIINRDQNGMAEMPTNPKDVKPTSIIRTVVSQIISNRIINYANKLPDTMPATKAFLIAAASGSDVVTLGLGMLGMTVTGVVTSPTLIAAFVIAMLLVYSAEELGASYAEYLTYIEALENEGNIPQVIKEIKKELEKKKPQCNKTQ